MARVDPNPNFAREMDAEFNEAMRAHEPEVRRAVSEIELTHAGRPVREIAAALEDALDSAGIPTFGPQRRALLSESERISELANPALTDFDGRPTNHAQSAGRAPSSD